MLHDTPSHLPYKNHIKSTLKLTDKYYDIQFIVTVQLYREETVPKHSFLSMAEFPSNYVLWFLE